MKSRYCDRCGIKTNKLTTKQSDDHYGEPYEIHLCKHCFERSKYTNTLDLRLTHKYVDSCRHLDEHVTVGYYNTVVHHMIEYEAECPLDRSMTTYIILQIKPVIPKDLDRKRWGNTRRIIEYALDNEFRQWGCSHEHDCCGCPLTSVRKIKYIRDGEWLVVTETTFNY